MFSEDFNPKAIFPMTTIPVATPLIKYEHSSYVELSVMHSHGPFRVPSGILGLPEPVILSLNSFLQSGSNNFQFPRLIQIKFASYKMQFLFQVQNLKI